LGGGEAQVADLVEGLDLRRAGGPLGHHQRPDRLHGPIPGLRRPARPARQRCPGRLDRIQRVGLPAAAAGLPVGAVHLDPLPRRRPAGTGPAPPRRTRCPPPRPTGPNPDSQPSRSRCPAKVVGNSATPSSPPTRSSAAATLTSKCVSTPPVTKHDATLRSR